MRRRFVPIGAFAAVLVFLISFVRFEIDTPMTCVPPPAKSCVFKVGVSDATVDRVCFREIGHVGFLACQDVGQFPLQIRVWPQEGPLVFEAITIDRDRTLQESEPGPEVGFIPDPTWPDWRNRAYLALKTVHFEW